jgi:hypothetical protein
MPLGPGCVWDTGCQWANRATRRVVLDGQRRQHRTIQRLYHTILPWTAIQRLFFQKQFLQLADEYLIAGYEVVVNKAGKETYGLDHFFAWLKQKKGRLFNHFKELFQS